MQQDRNQHAALRAEEHIGEDQRLGQKVSEQQPRRLALHRATRSPDRREVPQAPVEPEDQAGSEGTVADEEPWQEVPTPAQLFAESVGEGQNQERQPKRTNRQGQCGRARCIPRLAEQHRYPGNH